MQSSHESAGGSEGLKQVVGRPGLDHGERQRL